MRASETYQLLRYQGPFQEIGVASGVIHALARNRNNVYKLGHDGRRSRKKALTASGMTSEYVKWVFSE
jgi:hypothetical protein